VINAVGMFLAYHLKMLEKDYPASQFPVNIWFDGAFLNNKTGIGRDSRHLLKAIQRIQNITLSIVANNETLTHKIWRMLKLIILNKPEKIELPPGTIFIQSHIHNLLPKGNHFLHVIRMHDLFPITNPEWFRKVSTIQYSRLFKLISKDSLFLCDSRTTQNDLLKLGVNRDLTDVINCPVQISNTPPCLECKGCSFDSEINYLLTVGTIEPRKNYSNLIPAWQHINGSSKNNFKIVIIGKPGWKSKKILRILRKEKIDSDLIWLEDTCDNSLSRILANSGAVISCSLNEGFNLPLAEALEFGKKIVVSDIPVHREIYGKSAYFFSNKSEKDIQSGILKAIKISSKNFNNFNNYQFENDISSISKYIENIILDFSQEKPRLLT